MTERKDDTETVCEERGTFHFASLESIETSNVSLGAERMPPLELFDCVVKKYDLLVLWNEEVRKLLEQDVQDGVLDVTY